MSAKRFRIAFSFAGEKRDFVAKAAAILAVRFGEPAILYDKYHEAEFARYDLGIYLPKLYRDESDLVVAVLCPEYDQKPWTGWEWMAIHAQLTKKEGSKILLSRFERAHVDGLFEGAAFVELDDKTPEQTATLILQRLAINEGKPKDHYTADSATPALVASTTIPNNLPRLQPFFGRTEELKQIAEALDPEARTWGALIDGPGGMGKTSLAVRAAYDCPAGQFQRIIFLSVKDRELDDDGERQLGTFILPGFLEMLNELARELGQPDITKSPENERVRLILEAFGPSQALLILDNLESLTKADRDQLFTFVKRLPQGCKAILTSRRRIGSSADVLILEKLDEAAALETLAELARHNPLLAKTNEAERLTLYTQTGGKPLLLRWVAGQLGRGSCRSFTDALHFLRSCPPDNDPLEFIFGDLAQEFTGEETKVLAGLTYFTLPAKVEHIAEVTGLEQEPSEMALRTLANRSLVLPDQEEKAFMLVPMVADFLRRKRPEVVAETGSRLEQRAYALIVENGYEYDHFSILDDAWPTVAPALPLFVAGPNPRLQTVCDALPFFFEYTGRWDESLSLNKQAEAKAVAAGDHSNAGWLAYRAGYVYALRGQADAVLACADRATTHWQTARAGARERAVAIQLRGLGHKLKADYPAAIAAYREALDLSRTSSAASADVAVILNSLAGAEKNFGDLRAAERDYSEALRLCRASEDARDMVGVTTSNLAGLALVRKDWPRAETLAREAMPLAEKMGRQELIADNCLRLAQALVRQGKSDEALEYVERAVEIYTQLGSADLEDARETLRECFVEEAHRED